MRYAKGLGIAVLTVFGLATCVTPWGDHTRATAFEDYQLWTRVNPAPITGDDTGMLGRSTHGGASGFRNVFVNRVGQEVSSGAAPLPYPLGTIIVKETLTSANGEPGRLAGVTAMVKREAGYDPDHNDWEYLNLSAGLRIRAAGALRACYECHIAVAGADYVFTDNR